QHAYGECDHDECDVFPMDGLAGIGCVKREQAKRAASRATEKQDRQSSEELVPLQFAPPPRLVHAAKALEGLVDAEEFVMPQLVHRFDRGLVALPMSRKTLFPLSIPFSALACRGVWIRGE